MNNFDERCDCKRLRFSAMEEVAKNVLKPAAVAAGSDRRRGIAIAASSRVRAVEGCDG